MIMPFLLVGDLCLSLTLAVPTILKMTFLNTFAQLRPIVDTRQLCQSPHHSYIHKKTDDKTELVCFALTNVSARCNGRSHSSTNMYTCWLGSARNCKIYRYDLAIVLLGALWCCHCDGAVTGIDASSPFHWKRLPHKGQQRQNQQRTLF